jgi:hypothetical protein
MAIVFFLRHRDVFRAFAFPEPGFAVFIFAGFPVFRMVFFAGG